MAIPRVSWCGLLLGGFVLQAAVTALPGRAAADQVTVTYSPAGQVAPNFGAVCGTSGVCDYGVENFSNWNGSALYSASFKDAGAGTYNMPAGVSLSGTYTAGPNTTTGPGGDWVSQSQDQYGGINGQRYPELFGNYKNTSYLLSVAATGLPGANYFGVWISALDPYNNLKIYDGSNVVATITSPGLLAALGSCSDPSQNAYCGNPTAAFKGQDPGELFVYVNVFDLDGYITGVQFSNGGNTGFETGNHALAYLDPDVPIPEPKSFLLLVSALAGFALVRRGAAIRLT